ncbi:Nif3-like dinuclear metal center hexameric protein [Candidatus Babeliales bacterium]|nr:Nif3-like dinuclear metal center hexameric protein [Candidatus Babeliales bacterium]
MIELKEIVSFLNKYLNIEKFKNKDDSWNGLQVEGRKQIEKILFAVDAGIKTFQKAKELNVDMIVVHHGMFWKGANPSTVDYTKNRLDFLLKNEISLYASHLPLDAHPESGNNAQLLNLLGFKKDKEFCYFYGEFISFIGKTKDPKTVSQIRSVLEEKIGSSCKVLNFGKEKISTIAVCSGGGANYKFLNEAIELGVDLYLTGDATEMYHLAKDIGINIIFAGHHATETLGVKALSEIVKDEFKVDTVFVDIPTGL